MFGRATATAAATAALTLAFGVAAASAAGPIVPSSAADVDYHTEGQIVLGGNIGIHTDRAPNQGQALTLCDPDPRPAPNVRPDDCGWAIPGGTGRDLVNLGRNIIDADESPNGAYTPVATDSRDRFNGKAIGFGQDGPVFELDGHFAEDEDMHFKLTPLTLDAYLAPNGDANNRWRRFCGTGTVEQFNNQDPGGAEDHPALPPFVPGQVRKFIAEVWDADFRDPSDNDGGNQDYWVIDMLAPGSLFDVSACQTTPLVPVIPPPVTPPPPLVPPGVTPIAPTAIAGSLPPLVSAAVLAASQGPAQIQVSGAAARGPGGCVATSFKVAVRGANIQRVDFSLDGKRLSRVLKRDKSGMFRTTINVSALSRRTHRVTARVAFFAGSSPRVRSLPIAFRRCAKAVAAPAFTG